MMKKLIVFVFFSIFNFLNVSIAVSGDVETLPEDIQKSISTKYGNIESFERSKLDDGREYYAISTRDNEEDTSVHVLLKEKDGKISQFIDLYGCTGPRGDCGIRTSGNSLYIDNAGSGGACLYGSSSAQYKMIDGNFQLIGYEDIKSNHIFDIHKSINLLTNKIIISYREASQQNNKTHIKKRREQVFSFNTPKKWRLNDLSGFESWQGCMTALNIDDAFSACDEAEFKKISEIQLSNNDRKCEKYLVGE